MGNHLASPARLRALRNLALLDTEAEEGFDRITRMATAALRVPVSLVSLVDADRQYFKSCRGLPEPWASARQTPLSHSFCQHVVATGQPLVIPDARADARVRDNLAIRDLGVAAYAGVPLVLGGHAIGSLCAIDGAPREWTEEDLALLHDLGAVVMSEIELRGQVAATRFAEQSAADAGARLRSTLEGLDQGVAITGADGLVEYASPRLLEMTAHGWAGLLGRPLVATLCRPEDAACAEGWIASACAGERTGGELWIRRADGALFPAEVGAGPLNDGSGAVAGAVIAVSDITWRRHKEEALQESEDRFRSVFAHAGLGIGLVGAGGVWLDTNPALERLLDRRGGELLGRPMGDFAHPDDARACREMYARLWTGDAPSRVEELRFVRGGGELVWTRLTATRYTDAGTGDLVLLLAEDITAQRRAEQALVQSERLLRKAQDIAGLGTWVCDLRTGHGQASGSYFGLLCAAPGTRPGFDAALERVHTEDRERVIAVWREAMARGGPFEYEQPIVRPDGGIRHLHLRGHASTDEQGRAADTMGVVQDVTAWREAEEELRRQAIVFATMQEAVILMDPQGTIVDWNPGAERLLGYPREQVIGRPARALVSGGEESVPRDEILAALAAQGRWEGEVPFLRANGRTGVADAVLVQLRDAEGSPSGLISVHRDVTERRALEDKLRQAQKMEAVGQLAGGIAHDFNNIMMAVNGFAQLALRGTAPGDPRVAWLEEIGRGAARAADLTRQLLAFSRRQVLRPEPVDLNAAVSALAPLLQRVVGEHVTLGTHLAPGLPDVWFDRGNLDQVLMNLALNARDAMPQGGVLRISTAAGRVEPGAHAELAPGEYAVLTVEDSGEGIAPELLGRVFEPFFTTRPQGKGTGMGLSTVHGILAQSGGAVEVESTPGAGATFRVYLPWAPASAGRPSSAAGAADAATVLLVEDDPSVRGIALEVLRAEGYRVLAAANGVEALALASGHAEPIHLLVSDVMMPGMGGPELARRLRLLRPELRVGFLSGYPEEDAGLPRGAAHGFAQKPISPAELAAWVRSLLGGLADGMN
ncbi:MAG TPA: PAS domain S-box protein [Longimicrobium sp.]|jgi:PAS domain S-box-containing protein|uniref:PAS domain S-box protein n=1 Tax=Longimicrobium sp. TaxID=2029185 RepID=UPI002ED7F726